MGSGGPPNDVPHSEVCYLATALDQNSVAVHKGGPKKLGVCDHS